MAQTYTVTLQTDKTLPQLASMLETVAEVIGVTKQVNKVSVTALSKEFGLSTSTIRDKLKSINEGTDGKHVYDYDKAKMLLQSEKTKRGRPRSN